MKLKLFNRYMDETADGTDGQQAAGGNRTESNEEDNLLSYDSLWQSDDDGADGNGGQNSQASQQSVNSTEAFDNHVASLDFTGKIDFAEGLQAIRDGDVSAFAEMMHQIGAQAYKNALIDANKVVEQRVNKMSETVKSDISASNATSQVVQEMNRQLPFTKQAAYAPMAKAVLGQIMSKGVSADKAINEVNKYFQNLSKEIGGSSPKPPHGRPAGHFGGTFNQQSGNAQGGEPDWVEILGGPAN